MAWRYWVGKSINEVTETALRCCLPGRHFYPAGRICAFDLQRFYDLRKRSPKIILDVGANVGQTCLYFRRWFPLAQIFSLEPVRSTYETLAQNAAKYPNIHCRNVALGETEGTKTIRLMRNSELNTLMKEPSLDAEASEASEQIRVTTLARFCQEESIAQIDLLKMDTQGYELNILEGAGDLLDRTAFILAEAGLQEKREDLTPFGKLQDYLRSRDFCFCGLYEPYRHWDAKLLVSFANALYANTKWLDSVAR